MTSLHAQLRTATSPDARSEMAAIAAEAGLQRIHILTWRDIDHPWAGGSEIHINEVARCWAQAGLEVTIRTGSVAGGRTRVDREGYRVVRSGGRLSVLLHAPTAGLRHRLGPRDALVEVWHGVNFMTPLWAPGPRVGVVHHVHGPQFREVLPRGPADVAMFLERRVYPSLYRRSRLVAVSESTRRELVALGFHADRISVVESGVGNLFAPGGSKSPTPLVLSVARFMPQKRVPLLVEILAELRRRNPTLEAVLVGDGPERPEVESRIRELGCADWLHLAGRVDGDHLLDLYRRAWVLASASSAEGWGLTITEAAACGTPSVVSRIPGHEDAVLEGVSGFLAADSGVFVDRLDAVINDDGLRARLTQGAFDRVQVLQWPQTASRLLRVLADEALVHRRSRDRRRAQVSGAASG
jgi:glycosyltransferase involved in cell wall biosynthesis